MTLPGFGFKQAANLHKTDSSRRHDEQFCATNQYRKAMKLKSAAAFTMCEPYVTGIACRQSNRFRIGRSHGTRVDKVYVMFGPTTENHRSGKINRHLRFHDPGDGFQATWTKSSGLKSLMRKKEIVGSTVAYPPIAANPLYNISQYTPSEVRYIRQNVPAPATIQLEQMYWVQWGF